MNSTSILPGTRDSLTLYSNRLKSVGYLSLFLVLFVGFLWILKQPHLTSHDQFMGWVGICLFGFVILLFSPVVFFPKRYSLSLTPEGFTVNSLFGSRTLKWNDVKEFMVVASGRAGIKRVVFNYSDTYKKGETTRKVMRNLVGYEEQLGAYGMKAEDLADLLSRWQEYHTKTSKT